MSSLGISSKLDFGSDNAGTKQIIIKDDGSSQYKVVNEEKKADFDGIGVVCVSGNCNKTTAESNGVSTDVLVHVKTNVGVTAKNNTKEDLPDVADVPVVVGYGSSSVQTIPNNDGILNQISPTYNYDLNPPEAHRRTEFVPLQPDIIIPEINTNFRPSRPLYHPKTDPRNYKNVGFDENNVQIQVPHRPYFVNHYFGEHPPPQLVWYPNGPSQSYNPLEFKRARRPLASGINWNNIRSHTANQISHPAGTTCTCYNDGSSYYPSTPVYHIRKRTAESRIGDKLDILI